MARITVEDCLKKIPNRFQMVLVAAYRARHLTQGYAPKVEAKDKPAVVNCQLRTKLSSGQARFAAKAGETPGLFAFRAVDSAKRREAKETPAATEALLINTESLPL